MPFSVASLVSNTSALARLQAPSGYPTLTIKIVLTYGLWQGLHVQMAKSGLGELSLNNAVFLLHL